MALASFKTRIIGIGPREGETVPVETPTNIHAVLDFCSGALITLGASWDVCAQQLTPLSESDDSIELKIVS